MSIAHLSANVQAAMRVEARATAIHLIDALAVRRPSNAASFLALTTTFVSLMKKAGMKQDAQTAMTVFARSMETLLSKEYVATPAEVERAASLAGPDVVPPNSNDVVVANRKAAVTGATPIQDEPR